MITKKNLVILLAILCYANTFAQQNVGFKVNIISPLVSDGGSVTFTLRAPHARTVNINGDWSRIGLRTNDNK